MADVEKRRWSVPRMWAGDTVAILGGGASLTPEQIAAVRDRCRVVAINDAYLLAPFADMLYFCDRRWHGWHKDRPQFQAFAGLIVTLENYDLGFHSVHNMGREGLYDEPDGVMTGCNSGIQAINIAAHAGVARILLLGYDMKPGGWHENHKVTRSPGVYKNSMLPNFPSVAEALDRRGIECINCSPGSALEVFPRKDLADCLPEHTGPL